MALTTNYAGNIDDFSIKPRDLTNYSLFRGVTDFTQIGQFDQFETGYSFLSVLEMPTFITKLADANTSTIKPLATTFKKILEYEFRGLTGLPDVQGETYTITDGINEQNIINKVTADTSIEISMNYFEKRGAPLTRFTEYYLTGIKDRMSQAKTYHGLIKNDLLDPGLENEVFTMMYMVTDNTFLRLERAFLLCNCQLNKAETSMYDSTKGDISNKELTLTFNCFPVWGTQVNKAARILLQDITGVYVSYDNSNSASDITYQEVDAYSDDDVAALDSNNYYYGIMGQSTSNTAHYSSDLKEAMERSGGSVKTSFVSGATYTL